MYPIETKPFFLTSEFLAALLAIAALAIGAATDDSFDGRLFWILFTVVVSFYMFSRGLAKSGSKGRGWDPRDDLMARAGGEAHDRD